MGEDLLARGASKSNRRSREGREMAPSRKLVQNDVVLWFLGEVSEVVQDFKIGK